MTEVQISASVFNDAYYPHLYNQARVQIFFGGSASGKSVFVVQRAIVDVMAGGRNYLVARQVARTLRGSVMTEFQKAIDAWGVASLFSINKTDGTITCVNGYQIVFVGLDDVEKLKSITPAKGVFTDIWIEEATETTEDSYRQLLKRQRGGSDDVKKRIILSFNPILQQHWIYKRFFAGIGWAEGQTEYNTPDLLILKTTYKDNRFLTDDDRRDLENETDPYFYNVYTLGNWGVLGDVIFTNWTVQDLEGKREQFTNRKHGGDFGFAGHPAAIAATHYDREHETIYLYGELYETGLDNEALAAKTLDLIGNDYIVWDSAEPKSISELRKFGVSAGGAVKGKDSVTFGVQWLKRQKIVIDTRCVNAQNEFMTYQWKKDAGGNSLPVPVDRNNHIMDALRYAYEDESSGASWFVT